MLHKATSPLCIQNRPPFKKNIEYILLIRLQARMPVPNMAFYNLLVFLANVTSTNSHFFFTFLSFFFFFYLFIF